LNLRNNGLIAENQRLNLRIDGLMAENQRLNLRNEDKRISAINLLEYLVKTEKQLAAAKPQLGFEEKKVVLSEAEKSKEFQEYDNEIKWESKENGLRKKLRDLYL